MSRLEKQPTIPDREPTCDSGPAELAPLEVVVEIPRGSFVKRGYRGRLDFISPLPCPFNYGSVRGYIGLEGEPLDAVVLGPRVARGTCIRVRAFGAVGLTDRGLYDDKLICGLQAPTARQRWLILCFFRVYALAKGVLNRLRGCRGIHRCEGWSEPAEALARARPCRPFRLRKP